MSDQDGARWAWAPSRSVDDPDYPRLVSPSGESVLLPRATLGSRADEVARAALDALNHSDGVSQDSTPLQDAATQVHEMFTAFVDAGFTREEAIAIVLAQLARAVPPEAATK